MPINSYPGKPGVTASFGASPRDIFFGNRQDARFAPGGVTIDGTASGNPANTPYVWNLWGGQAVGKVTSSGKFATSILGVTTAAYTSGGTTLTVSAAVATEVVRRLGASGTMTVTGPPSAAGTVAATVTTYSAVNTTTGVITVTSLGVNKVTGVWIQPVDGSETIVSLLAQQWGLPVITAVPHDTTRADVFANELYAGGGTINVAMIDCYPADASLKTYMKAAIRLNVGACNFSDDLTNT